MLGLVGGPGSGSDAMVARRSRGSRAVGGGGATSSGAADRCVWTVDAVRSLGVPTDVETAGAILGLFRTKAYELAKAGAFPVTVVRIGRLYVVPVLLPLFNLLGVG